jgi:hypothetical protein
VQQEAAAKMTPGRAQALHVTGQTDGVGFHALEDVLGQDDLLPFDPMELMEANDERSELLLLQRDDTPSIDVPPWSLETQVGEQSLSDLAVGCHRLQLDLAAKRALFMSTRDQERKRTAPRS